LVRKTSRTIVHHGPATPACLTRSQLSNFLATGTSLPFATPAFRSYLYLCNYFSPHLLATRLTGKRGTIAAATPPNKGRGQRGQRDTKPAPSKEKNPSQEISPAPQAPRGSPIAKRLARCAPHPWTALTVPHRTMQISPPPLCMSTMLASACMPCTSYLSLRPPQGKNVSHRRPSVPRAGSPAYGAPRLVVLPSGP